MNLDEIIATELEPVDFIERLDITTPMLVRAFSLQIYMNEEVFDDLLGVQEVNDMYDETDPLERDVDPIEERLSVHNYEDYSVWEQSELLGDCGDE
jgi:hypothetical protein